MTEAQRWTFELPEESHFTGAPSQRGNEYGASRIRSLDRVY